MMKNGGPHEGRVQPPHKRKAWNLKVNKNPKGENIKTGRFRQTMPRHRGEEKFLKFSVNWENFKKGKSIAFQKGGRGGRRNPVGGCTSCEEKNNIGVEGKRVSIFFPLPQFCRKKRAPKGIVLGRRRLEWHQEPKRLSSVSLAPSGKGERGKDNARRAISPKKEARKKPQIDVKKENFGGSNGEAISRYEETSTPAIAVQPE